MKRCDILAAVGIIAEFNPLHTGHKLLINEAKKLGTVVCVMSGNFVQRGDIAIAEKHIRAKAALLSGADLVLELPVCWAMSSAQNFALGGVSILNNIGCDTLMFGSECGQVSEIKRCADILSSEEYREHLSEFLKTGITFAAAREKAALLCGLENDILSKPNNNLAVEYITAAEKIGANFNYNTIKRLGAAHDSNFSDQDYVSASLLREKLKTGDTEFCKKYIPSNIQDLYKKDNISDFKMLENAVLAVLRTKSPESLKSLPDLSEGIENKLFSAIRLASSVEELYNNVKVKRYTHARIRRLVLSAFTGIDNSFFMKTPPYIRVLGFNESGEKFLKTVAKSSPIPVITKAKEILSLSDENKKIFEWECKAADLFSLSLKNPLPCGTEFTAKLIKTECC